MELPDHIPPEIARQLPVELPWLPALPAMTTAEMVDQVAGWVAQVSDKMLEAAGRGQLRQAVKQCVRAGTLSTMKVIEAAERYTEIDQALREMLVEGVDDCSEATAIMLAGFQKRALLRNITTNPAGYHASPYQRDIGISVLMALVTIYWPGIKRNHNPASKRPSASYVVCEALKRCGVGGLTPSHVAKIYDNFGEIAGRLSRLIAA